MKLPEAIRSLFAKGAFDVRDVLLVGGLVMLGYGLYSFCPWVSFTVCGVLLMAGGILMERKNGTR